MWNHCGSFQRKMNTNDISKPTQEKQLFLSFGFWLPFLFAFITAGDSFLVLPWPSTTNLKQYRFIISQFWKLEVWNQGIVRATLLLKPGKNNISLPLPNFWLCPAALGIPWLATMALWSLPLSSPGLLLSVSSRGCLLMMSVILDHIGSIMTSFLTWLNLQRPYFQARSCSQVLNLGLWHISVGNKTLTYQCGKHNVTPNPTTQGNSWSQKWKIQSGLHCTVAPLTEAQKRTEPVCKELDL